jgi:bacterioferritin
MKSSRSILTELNQVLGIELIAINQYFLHARILKNWGIEELGEKEYDASIRAMKDADHLIERILFLEGLPNLQNLGKLSIGQTTPEILKCDLTLETTLRGKLLDSIAFCEKESDFVSREILASILEKSEERLDFYETELELIGKLGLENYLQKSAESD